MDQSDTFLSYLTDEHILGVIIREAKKAVSKPHHHISEYAMPLFRYLPPPYSRIGTDEFKMPFENIDWIAIKHILLRHIGDNADYGHVKRFYGLSQSLRAIAANPERYDFPKPVVKACIKSEGEQIVECRPICTYHDMRAKLLTSLMARYMKSWLEPMLHETNMAYRSRRTWMGQEDVAVVKTSFSIDYIMRWRAAHDGQPMYVAECDMRKFFDSINHADLCRVFIDMHHRAGKNDKAFERLFCRFVDSFDFASDVMIYNSNHDDWWQQQLKHAYDPNKRYVFKWISSITEPSGIPQGVALSPVIANMLLNVIDEQMLGDKLVNGHIVDPNLLYIRYSDDNLLIHTDKDECNRLIQRYAQCLHQHHLHPHDFQSVALLKRKGMTDYWNAKSKSPFLWGSGWGDSALWIGFVGYEIRRDGAVRLRKSSVAKLAESIFRKSEKIKHSGEKAPDRFERFCAKAIGGSTLDGISCIADDTQYRHQRALLEQLKARKIRHLRLHI